jgi:hypothetical protein
MVHPLKKSKETVVHPCMLYFLNNNTNSHETSRLVMAADGITEGIKLLKGQGVSGNIQAEAAGMVANVGKSKQITVMHANFSFNTAVAEPSGVKEMLAADVVPLFVKCLQYEKHVQRERDQSGYKPPEIEENTVVLELNR